MADLPDWAKGSAPVKSAPLPAWAKAPAAKPAAPASPPSLWSRAVDDVKSMGSGIADAWNKAPERRAEGQAMVSRQNKMRMVDAERERFKSATGTVRQAFGDVKRDFTTPLDVTKGRMALPARIGKTGLDVVGAAFSPIAAGITELVGPEVQAATGIHRDTVGNLTSGVVPLGGITKLAKLAKGTETGRAMTGAVSRAGGRLTAPLARAKAAGQRTFSPETIDEAARDTATLHRAAHGTRRGEASAERYALERHHRVVAKSSPAEQEALAKYVDTGGKVALPDKLKGAAEAMRGVYTRYRSRIENVLGEHEGPQFIKDYYARFWRNTPDEVDKAFRDKPIGGRQGSGRNLRKRSIPTYEEGLARGLKPMFTNPLDATAAYADNMASYLATHETLKGMRRTGLAKWAYKTKVPKNMVPLEGLGTTKPAMLNPKGAMIPERVLVAPDNAARVYNRTVSKGLDKGSFGPVYRGARAASNAVSQMKLGLSLFHATVMGEEGFVSAFAKGANRVLRGDIGGVKDMAKSPGAIVSTTAKGGRLRKAILDPDNAETHLKGMDPGLAKMYQRVGGRANMDRFYSTGSVSGGFWRGIKSGTLGHEFVDALRDVKSSPIKGTLRLVGKMLDTASAPIFKELVPRIKAGAWASRMEQWLKDNPDASAVERQRYGETLVNNMDNRFGELIQDNQFWDRAHFQIGQLLMLSPSWNFGTVREIGGGLAELPKSVRMAIKGKGVTDKTAYVGALAATFMVQNGIATYLHTGEHPQGEDWLAYRTGGKDQNGDPERGLIPGYMKDVLAFTTNFPHNVGTELANKANPALSLTGQLATNKDHFDKPVYNPAGGVVEQAGEAAQYVGEQMKPISMSQPGRGPDSGFTTAETAIGVRRAPAYLENPERKAAMDKKYGEREWKAKLKADRKRAAREGAPAQSSPLIPEVHAGDLPDWAKGAALPDWARDGAAVKPGATNGGAVRPEFKPVVDFISRLDGVDRITAENDMFHPASDVHGQGRAMDFTIKGGKGEAAAFASRLRQRLHAEGFTRVRVLDEYNNPSRGATGGHIHVQYS